MCFGLFAGSAFAQTPTPSPTPTTLTYNDGDLFLGFRATDRTSDYLVNIGPPDQFVNAPPGSTFQVAVGNTGADLAIALGSDWCNRIDPNTGRNAVFWAVTGGRQIGAMGDPDNTLYSTNPLPNPWPRRSDTAQSFTTSLIAAMGNTFAGNQSTVNNPQGLIQSATSTNSYASFQPGGANSGGISFQTWNPSNERAPSASLLFNRIAPGSGPSTVLGTFLLDCSGGVSFTAPVAPTPTPSPTPTATATVAPTPSPTPTSTVPPAITMSGTVIYCSNPTLPPVPGVLMTLTGTSSGSQTTGVSGTYSFTGLTAGGNYTVTPTKAALPSGTSTISTVDVIAIQGQSLLRPPLLTGCQLTAADVNGVGGITTVDVLAVQAFALGRVSGFANTGQYRFTPVSRSYTPLVADQTAQNYDAVVLGDVKAGFVHRPEGGTSQDAAEVPSTVAAVALPEVAVDQSKTNFTAAVTTSAIAKKSNLVGFQGDFTFDERVVTFQSQPASNAGLTGGNWNVTGNVLPGTGPIRTLRISAYSNDFSPLSGSGTLFNLNMTRVSKGAQDTSLLWAVPPDHFIFIDADLNSQRPGNAALGGVTTSGKRN